MIDQSQWKFCALVLLAGSLGLLPPVPSRADDPADLWPASVHAHYRLRYMDVDIGRLEITSETAANTYKLSGSGKVSALFGAVNWSGSTSAVGSIGGGSAVPSAYDLEWKNNKKTGATHVRFTDHTATEIEVTPPPKPPKPDVVPLAPAHKAGALDPVSAIMALTKADDRPPCDRRIAIFDGQQRYDIVLSFKRMTRVKTFSGDGHTEAAVVCRAMYEPVAGHRANEDTKAYAANRDVEVVMRHVPGTRMMIPSAITVPTVWGTGSMAVDRIDVVSKDRKFTMTE